MHHNLKRGSGFRKSLVRDCRGLVYINAACVPRSGHDAQGRLLRHFSWAEFTNKKLSHLSHRWYASEGQLIYEEKINIQV